MKVSSHVRRRTPGAKGRRSTSLASTTPDLAPAERAELQRQGAKSAARGEPAAVNPMERQVNSAEVTGESAARLAQRSQAWQQGHDAQTAVPGEARRPAGRAPRGGRDDER